MVVLELDEEGGRLLPSQSFASSSLLRAIATPPNVRFRWENVEVVTATRGLLSYRAVRFLLRGRPGFTLNPGLARRYVVQEVVDFARARGVPVEPVAKFVRSWG